MEISVKHDLQNVARQLTLLGSDVLPKAASRAMNNAAFQARKDLQGEISRVFDRPTRWAMNAPWVDKAKPNKLATAITLDNWRRAASQYSYIIPEIQGGPRRLKRSEKLLQERGILPPGMYAVPGAGARIDAYGNMSRAQMQQILAQVRAHFDPKQRTPLSQRTQYFHAIVKGTNGIWQRTSAGLRPVLVFVRPPRYRVRLRFREVAERAFQRHWQIEFPTQVKAALRR